MRGRREEKMANMSYCRFQNTLPDLRDCYDNMDEDGLSESEERSRKAMLVLCKRIADDYEDEIEEIIEEKLQRQRPSVEAKSND